MPLHPERRAHVRQVNTARHIADARADARRLREVLEGLTNLSMAGQIPSASDLQTALALARITEFQTTRAARSMEDAVRAFQEPISCL